MSLRLLSSCAALISALTAVPAAAQESSSSNSAPTHRRHLLQGTVRGGAAWLGGDIQGLRGRSAFAGLGIGYSLATRGVDLGAGLDFLGVPDTDHPSRAYIPTLTLRFHAPLSTSAEFGLGLRAGWSWVTMSNVEEESGRRDDHTFNGVHLGLLPHARFWLTPRLALDAGVELLVAGGGDNLGTDARSSPYRQRSARFGVLGAFFRVNVGL